MPGVGPTSTDRILQNRQQHSIDNWRDLQTMGVVRKRASPFLVFSGHRPPRAKQLRLDLFNQEALLDRREQAKIENLVRGGTTTPTTAPCGQATSCTGCPMYGMPGHPGS